MSNFFDVIFNVAVGDKLAVKAGAEYVGEVTEVKKDGVWLTEDKKTEEFIAFLDVEEINVVKEQQVKTKKQEKGSERDV